jgi:hypothetical protein
MSYNCAYVRQHYLVPAEVGRRVIAYGKPGVILADRGHYIGVVLDDDPKRRIQNYHPTHEMQYGEMAESLPLKEWKVIPPWVDVEPYIGDVRHWVKTVWAATRSQAKYKAYEDLQDNCYSSKAMCYFKARRA